MTKKRSVKRMAGKIELTETPQLIDLTCPICGQKLWAWKDATGIMLKCKQPISVCKSTENPFDHAHTVKEAYESMCERWPRYMGMTGREKKIISDMDDSYDEPVGTDNDEKLPVVEAEDVI